MYILAFESSCDETSASVLFAEDGNFIIKSNIIASRRKTAWFQKPDLLLRSFIKFIKKDKQEQKRKFQYENNDIQYSAWSSSR